jgi:hypothetical protein
MAILIEFNSQTIEKRDDLELKSFKFIYYNVINNKIYFKHNTMKKTLLFFLTAFITFQVTAQKTLETGHIKMEIIEATSDDEQMAMGLEMLKGTETNYYFDKERTLVSQSMMGGMVEVSTITKMKDKSMEMFFNMMGNKTIIETTEAEVKKSEGAETADMSKMKVVYDKNDKKKIAGYDCIKATISNPELEENEVSFTMYVSSDINASSKMIQTLSEFDIRGFPLEFSINMPNMKMVYSTTVINNSFDSSVFNVDRTGYTKMTMEEFQKQMGGMTGGLGF